MRKHDENTLEMLALCTGLNKIIRATINFPLKQMFLIKTRAVNGIKSPP